jgi:hypothetical protein
LTEGEFANSTIDLGQRLGSIEERDVRFMLKQFGWEFTKGWGASSNGWLCPATVGKVDLWFRQMINPAEHGVPAGHTGAYVWLDHPSSPEATAKWIREHGSEISWGKVLDGGNGRLIISHFLDLTQSPSVADIKLEVERVAAEARTLDLPRGR